MTMLENKCDVCFKNSPIGVASTAIPLSVAYCEECARRNAQPIDVFFIWEDDTPPKDHRAPDYYTAYVDGEYISYRKWYNARHPKTAHQVPIKEQKGSVRTKPKLPRRDRP